MTGFILLGVLLVLAGAAWVAWPLLRRTATGTDANAQRSLTGGIAVLVALPLLAAALYAQLSNYEWDPQKRPAAAHAGGDSAAQQEEIAALVKQLAARLEKEPGDLEGWRMLARTQLMTGDALAAVTTLERAVQLEAGNADALRVDLAEALVLTEQADNVARGGELIAAELAVNPQQPKALWYSGVVAMRAGDRASAVSSWQALSSQELPPQIRDMVNQQLTELGVAPVEGPSAPPSMAQETPPPAPQMGAASGPAAAATGRSVRVSVKLAPQFAARVKPDSVLFIAAREKGIPGPPLAARRIPAGSLPATIELSDADAVVPGRNLSSVAAVEITARIAFGGTAQTVAGDLLGAADLPASGVSELAVTIDRVAP